MDSNPRNSSNGLSPDGTAMARFTTKGLDREKALAFLVSEDGERYINLLSKSNKNISREQILDLSIEHVQSGRTLPQLETITEPLVKIVKPGTSVSPYTPYFAKLSDLQQIIESGESLSNKLELPIARIAVKAI